MEKAIRHGGCLGWSSASEALRQVRRAIDGEAINESVTATSVAVDEIKNVLGNLLFQSKQCF